MYIHNEIQFFALLVLLPSISAMVQHEIGAFPVCLQKTKQLQQHKNKITKYK